MAGADTQEGKKQYPAAHDKSKVGTYDLVCASGGGLRYDRVLEYRVWVRYIGMPAASCFNFSSHEDATKFASVLPKEDLLYNQLVVLVEQDWYYDEAESAAPLPEGGDTLRTTSKIMRNRKTEWQPEWLFMSPQIQSPPSR